MEHRCSCHGYALIIIFLQELSLKLLISIRWLQILDGTLYVPIRLPLLSQYSHHQESFRCYGGQDLLIRLIHSLYLGTRTRSDPLWNLGFSRGAYTARRSITLLSRVIHISNVEYILLVWQACSTESVFFLQAISNKFRSPIKHTREGRTVNQRLLRMRCQGKSLSTL